MLDITNARRRRDEKTEGGLLPTFLSRPMRAVRRRPRRWVFIALATVVCFTYFYFGHRTSGDVSWEDSWKAGKARTEEGGRQDAVVRQKISIIVIWDARGGEPPLYLPYFFQSVEANPEVDLLFINVDKEQKDCASYSSAPNVQEVCLTEKQCAFRPPPLQIITNLFCRLRPRVTCRLSLPTMALRHGRPQDNLQSNKAEGPG